VQILKTTGFLLILVGISAGAQGQGAGGGKDSTKVQVFVPGPEVTTPELIPIELQVNPPESCDEKMDGKVKLSLVVDADGRPRNIFFLHVLGNDLDRFALLVAGADKFKPGTRGGSPVAVAVSLEVGIASCVEETEDSAGKKNHSLKMGSVPVQELKAPSGSYAKPFVLSPVPGTEEASSKSGRIRRVGDEVSTPVPMNQVEAQFTDAAKKAGVSGVVLVSVVVDAHGLPQDPRIVRRLEPSLDQNALIAVDKYRFKPAMNNGTPVPVMIMIAVNFR